MGDEAENTAPLIEVLTDYRSRRTQLFGATEPPDGPIRIVGEFEPAHTLLMAYSGYELYDDVVADIIEEAESQGEVRVLVRPELARPFSALLRRRSISSSSISTIYDIPYDTVWIRDYGPQPIITGNGLAFVGGRYFLNCLRDDAVATRFAERVGGNPVFRTGLWTEGGNLLSNGRGLCVTTTYLTTQNSASDSEVSRALREFYGCQQTAFLRPLRGNARPTCRHVHVLCRPRCNTHGSASPGTRSAQPRHSRGERSSTCRVAHRRGAAICRPQGAHA